MYHLALILNKGKSMKNQTKVKSKSAPKAPKVANKVTSEEKVNLATATQVNGNLDSPIQINDFLKKREFPYKETSVAAYLKSLESMNISDLQRHAIEVAQILPNITERSRLVRKLEETYLKKQGKLLDFSRANGQSNVTPEAAESIRAIMSRGRWLVYIH